MSNPRVLKAHLDAARTVLAGFGPPADLLERMAVEVATAVVCAEDDTFQRAVIVTRLDRPGMKTEIDVYGVYASPESARAAWESGIHHHPDQRGAVFAVAPAPRIPRTKKKPTDKASSGPREKRNIA